MSGEASGYSPEEQPLDRAMPLILRMERDTLPPRSALLEAAASAAVALCCDERSQPGGPWYPEVAPWLATVTRLQVGGTDLPPDDAGPPPDGLPVLWFPPAPVMTVGKAAAQVGHATVLLTARLRIDGRMAKLVSWAATGYQCAVRTAGPHPWTALVTAKRPWQDHGVLTVRDAGFTEVPPGTITVAAHFPLR